MRSTAGSTPATSGCDRSANRVNRSIDRSQSIKPKQGSSAGPSAVGECECAAERLAVPVCLATIPTRRAHTLNQPTPNPIQHSHNYQSNGGPQQHQATGDRRPPRRRRAQRHEPERERALWGRGGRGRARDAVRGRAGAVCARFVALWGDEGVAGVGLEGRGPMAAGISVGVGVGVVSYLFIYFILSHPPLLYALHTPQPRAWPTPTPPGSSLP